MNMVTLYPLQLDSFAPLFVVGFAVLFIFIILISFIKRYKRCPSDRILVVYGKVGTGNSAKCIHGGASFIWPVIQDYRYLDLTPISIDVNLQDALSKQNIRVSVPAQFTVGVSNKPAIMLAAAERLLGLDQPSIRALAHDIIMGQMRLVIANMDLFFQGPLKKWLDKDKAKDIYHGLHVVTLETAFVVRTFFFVIFGITIVFSSLASWQVVGVSALCLAVIYVIRFIILRVSIGTDILPQLFIAPRGLITVLLFYAIPPEAQVSGFSEGIILFIIIGTSLIMTGAMIADKKRAGKSIDKANAIPIGDMKWKAPEL